MKLPVLFLAALTLLHAQSSTGELDITVADATDALIADVRVTVTGSETGAVVRTLKTNASGLAAVPLLNPGTYDIAVEKAGFKTLLQKGVVLRVTEVVSLRVTLELGATSQSVTIEGQAALVDASTNAEGQVMASATMQQLPLNGRNYLQLSVLTPVPSPPRIRISPSPHSAIEGCRMSTCSMAA